MAKSAPNYWSLSTDELLGKLHSSQEGLSSAEATQRLAQYGGNVLTEAKRTVLTTLISIFANPLFIVLIVASIVSQLVGQTTDAVIIVIMILLSASVDFYQQYHAERTVEKLRNRIALKATVVRDAHNVEMPVDQLTLGDVFLLESGEIVPADARIIVAQDLQIDQSTLTGEAFPQRKTSVVVAESATLNERTNCVYMGTSIISGEGRAIVTATAADTELGRIAKELAGRRPKTEFETGMNRFSLMLTKIIVGLVVFAFLATSLVRHEFFESFLFALALAVGLTPELLPMIVTINLSIGARRLAAKKVIVKDLRSIENFGEMGILCTDKTGTLTEGKISIAAHLDSEGKSDETIFQMAYIGSFFYGGYKGPLDKAILEHGSVETSECARVADIPFDFERKRGSTAVVRKGEQLLLTRGAPEGVLAVCTHWKVDGEQKTFTAEARQKVIKLFDELSRDGFRVLAIASKKLPKAAAFEPALEEDLTFNGLISFLDPPKVSAGVAVKQLGELGVEVKILTGDNEQVTEKVCGELKIEIAGTLTGEQIDKLTPGILAERARTTTIFARLTPEHKEQVIQALRSGGAVVGFMGDGINDGLAFHAADVGISVDNAADVAKSAASLILLEKDLGVLQEGIEDGRKTHGNVMKYIMMNTSSNFGNMFSVAIGALFLPFLPMLPTQILLNNLMYDFSQLALPVDRVDSSYLTKPKRWNISHIRHFMFVIGPISSVFDLLTFGALLLFFHAAPELFRTGWFVESVMTQTLIVFSIRTSTVPFWKSRPSYLLGLSTVGIVALALILPFTGLGRVFGFTAFPMTFLIFLVSVLVVYFVLVEFFKVWFYKRYPA